MTSIGLTVFILTRQIYYILVPFEYRLIFILEYMEYDSRVEEDAIGILL